ncbi:hypothetical protein LTR10_010751 [Elasticomyces elasticus]|nr:hypothetical protein LTR10_010751 [Elasticomyces elasticus]KAK4968357.1 hypothetical protein LTR42_009640 [Elasticomyces elasticus]
MEDAQSECSLLSLPRELRDFIWKNTIEDAPQAASRLKRKAVSQPAIAQVSKHIREETLPIFLSVTTFHLDFRNGAAIKKAKDWILRLDENTRYLRKVNFYHHVAYGKGDTYVACLTLDPWGPRKFNFLADVEYECTERMSLTVDAYSAWEDKRTALIWDLQYALNATIDDGCIRPMGRKEWLSVLFLIREYFDSTEGLFAEFGG